MPEGKKYLNLKGMAHSTSAAGNSRKVIILKALATAIEEVTDDTTSVVITLVDRTGATRLLVAPTELKPNANVRLDA